MVLYMIFTSFSPTFRLFGNMEYGTQTNGWPRRKILRMFSCKEKFNEIDDRMCHPNTSASTRRR